MYRYHVPVLNYSCGNPVCTVRYNGFNNLILPGSVADPGCLSRIQDTDYYPSRIPDLGFRIQKQEQKRGVKKNYCHTFFCSHKFHKIVNYLFLKLLKKKNLGQFSKN
jgi:hypothetical protein